MKNITFKVISVVICRQ